MDEVATHPEYNKGRDWRLLFSLFLVPFCLLAPCTTVVAQQEQQIEFGSTANPVGSGARAMGMGGAFIAVADDATAASWNPAGLIQLERPEFSAVGSFIFRTDQIAFGTNPEASGSDSVTAGSLNYISATYPFRLLDRNMVVSLNYQNLYNFDQDWSFTLEQEVDDWSRRRQIHYAREGNLYAIGIAYCIQIIRRLSLGFTLNIWESFLFPNQWTQTQVQASIYTGNGQTAVTESTWIDQFSFSGFNANVGLLWGITERLKVGCVFKTPFSATLDHESFYYSPQPRFADEPADQDVPDVLRSLEKEKLSMPFSFGIGVAYRFSDQLTISGDYYRTEWQHFVLTDSQGTERCPLNGKPVETTDVRPTNQVRVGADYLFVHPGYVIPVRAGFSDDPGPTTHGSPDDFFGCTFGSGLAARWFVFDLAYQYRFGRSVGSSLLEELDFSENVDEHTLYASTIIYF